MAQVFKRLFFCIMSIQLVLLQMHKCIEQTSSEGMSSGAATFSPFEKNEKHFWCPRRCTCSSEEKIIDCSSLRLKKLPVLPQTTKRLYLHNNLISSLQHHHFHMLDQLTYLILSGNNIEDIDPAVFSDLRSLKYLILDGNNLTKLPMMAFRELTDIETILQVASRISKNLLLENRSLAKNQLQVIPHEAFLSNNQLTLVNLQGNALTEIQSGAFNQLHQLATLNLEDNLLDERVFGALQGLGQLTTLRLNGNRIKRLPSEGLRFRSLKYLALHSNNIIKLPRILMENCSTLEMITLNQNAIEEIDNSIFKGCASLTKLFLQKNHLKSLSLRALAGLKSLKEIYLCNNQLRDLMPGMFHGLNALISIHLEWNELSFIAKGTFYQLPKLETIYLHRNTISNIEPGAFLDLPHLKYLALYRNNFRTIRPVVLNSLNSLQKIQLDPLKCSCSLLPLVAWLKSHHIKGVNCIKENGQMHTLSGLEKSCHSPKGNFFWQRIRSNGQVNGIPHVNKHKSDRSKGAAEMPKGPPFHPSKEEKLAQRIHFLERTIAQLHFKVLRLEALMMEESHSCHRIVCFYDGVRLLVGDKWKNNEGKSCSCLHDGNMDCS